MSTASSPEPPPDFPPDIPPNIPKIKFDKTYDPKRVEVTWYERWQNAGCFQAQDSSKKPPFSVVIPPPNVTGSLHMGHALDETLQDILVRFKRMDGFNTLWMPGTDHAGIATQNVVEKLLLAQGKNREAMGREAFLEEVWKWKTTSGDKIINQLKRLGASCDWQRLRFTMDEGLSRAVRQVFVELYEQKLIYRDNYIIHWCPHCLTALSDLEVEHTESAGKLYFIKYLFAKSSEFLTVATTRPETMLGDTAVAVHPKDSRYKKMIGQEIRLPLSNRLIPLVADETVKMEFGTGAVKVTPAHDFNDFATGKRHNLAAISILDERAHIQLPGSPYHGLSISKARKAILEELTQQQLLLEEKPHPHQVGHCYRCHTATQPRISKQWFVKVKDLAKPAIAAVRKGKTKIIPAMWENNYFEWMENITDWCISRQIWWGHRIPVWNCSKCDAVIVSATDPTKCSKCASFDLIQDRDVLDTWFSSALWPFSTMGWPDKTATLKTFYPTSVLVTGFDILFFWVARMMMMGIKFMGEVPFHTVCIHALVRDPQGQKMSKSKGNVIDPLEIMDEYGTDALRFTLAALAVQGRDVVLSEDRIGGYRNFVNKIWNASRFLALTLEQLQQTHGISVQQLQTQPRSTHPLDHWIECHLSRTIKAVRAALEEMRFSDVANLLYHFVWHEFCDWYIEFSKCHFAPKTDQEQLQAKATAATLTRTLDGILRLMHPIMPFVTEEIWQKLMTLLGVEDAEFLMLAKYPKDPQLKEEASFSEIEFIKRLITTLRTLKSENGVPPGKPIAAFLVMATSAQQKLIRNYWNYIRDLAKLNRDEASNIFIDRAGSKQISGPVASAVLDGIEVVLPLGDLINVEKESARLSRELARLSTELTRTSSKLDNRDFVAHAPTEVVEEHRERLKRLTHEQGTVQAFLSRLKPS